MTFKMFRLVLMISVVCAALSAAAQGDPHVGDVAMSPKKTLLENLATSPIHKDWMEALHVTGIGQMLSSSGPYTVFAPTDDAFGKLPALAASLRSSTPDDALPALVKYHIVQGRLTSKRLGKLLKKGHNTITLQTLAGQPLTLKRYGSILVLSDVKGGTATVVTANVVCKNGVFDVIDAVLMPN